MKKKNQSQYPKLLVCSDLHSYILTMMLWSSEV